MSEENTSIYEFELELICDYFSSLERQGPGSPESTLKALSFIENHESFQKILDIGCGTGGQTRILAGKLSGDITGVDLFPVFIDLFNQKALEQDVSDRVRGEVGDMQQLQFPKDELDLIWCEGAIYNIGFEKGLREWQKFLKPGGYIAVSEACWFTPQRPDEIEKFWMDAYPGIDTVPTKFQHMVNAGFKPIACFVLPDSCWSKHFFDPQERAREIFLRKHPGNRSAHAFVDYMLREAELFSRYSEYYGYAFFIGRKGK